MYVWFMVFGGTFCNGPGLVSVSLTIADGQGRVTILLWILLCKVVLVARMLMANECGLWLAMGIFYFFFPRNPTPGMRWVI